MRRSRRCSSCVSQSLTARRARRAQACESYSVLSVRRAVARHYNAALHGRVGAHPATRGRLCSAPSCAVARADDPPCPSQNPQPGETAAARRAIRRDQEARGDEDIEVSTDGAELRRTGDARSTATSRCARVSARSVPNMSSTTATAARVAGRGPRRLQDPLVHVSGDGGSYAAATAAPTSASAEFELPAAPRARCGAGARGQRRRAS